MPQITIAIYKLS